MLKLEQNEKDRDIEVLAGRIEHERNRCNTLNKANTVMRQQLDEMTVANRSLTGDLERLKNELCKANNEMKERQAEWNCEKRSLVESLGREQSRTVDLWRSVAALRRDFADMANSVRRDVGHIKSELNTSIRDVTDGLKRHLMNVAVSAELDMRPQHKMAASLQSVDRGSLDVATTTTGCYSESSAIAAVATAVNRSLVDDMARMEADNRRLSSTVHELRSRLSEIESERDELSSSIDRQKQENVRCRHVIEQSESKLNGFKSEISALQESVTKITLDRGLLEQQNKSLGQSNQALESRRNELENELRRVREELELTSKDIVCLQATVDQLTQEKIDLNNTVVKMERENAALVNARSSLMQDNRGLRHELVRVERKRVELEAMKSDLSGSLQMTEMESCRRGDELCRLMRERDDVIAQLSQADSQIETLSEQLQSLRREADSAAAELNAVGSDRDRRLVDLQTRLSAAEDDARQMQQTVAELKVERQVQDVEMEELREEISRLTDTKTRLESENLQLSSNVERLQGEVKQLTMEMTSSIEQSERKRDAVSQQLTVAETEYQMALRRERQEREEDVDRLTREKDAQHAQFEAQLKELSQHHQVEIDEMTSKHSSELARLERDLSNAARVRDEQLLLLESNKQQVLCDAERDRFSAEERISRLSAERDAIAAESERLRREMTSQREVDGEIIATLQDELNSVKLNLQTEIERRQSGVNELTARLNDAQRQKDSTLRELSELAAQLGLTEESRDGLRRDLLVVKQRLKEEKLLSSNLDGELTATRDQLCSETKEKDSALKTASELRNTLKRTEGEKTEISRILEESKKKLCNLEEERLGLQKEVTTLQSSLHEVEANRLQIERMSKDYKRRAKVAEMDCVRLKDELHRTNGDLDGCSRLVDQLKFENGSLQQQFSDSCKRNDFLTAKLADLELVAGRLRDELLAKDQLYERQICDFRMAEAELGERRRNLEVALDNSGASIAELQARCNEYEGRVRSLEAKLTQADATSHELSFKLDSVVSAVWRSVRSASSSGGSRERSSSPRRRHRPEDDTNSEDNGTSLESFGRRHRGGFGASDVVDLDDIHDALRDVVSRLKTTTSALDESKLAEEKLNVRVKEAEEKRSQAEQRLQSAVQTLQDEKRDAESRLASAQRALLVQEDVLRDSERDRKQLIEKVSALERNMSACEASNAKIQEKLNKVSSQRSAAEEDLRQYRNRLEEAETAITQTELIRRTIEGDLQRAKIALGEREAKILILQDQLSSVCDRAHNAESRVESLQTIVDRLTATLEKTAGDKFVSRQQSDALNTSLQEQNSLMNNMRDRITELEAVDETAQHLHRKLADVALELRDSRNDSAILERQNEALQQELVEKESQRNQLRSQLSQLNVQMGEMKEIIRDLNERLARETSDREALIQQVTALERIAAEADQRWKSAERIKDDLEKKLAKYADANDRMRQRHDDVGNKQDVLRLRQENDRLQECIQQLQQQMTDAEHEHTQRLLELTSHQAKECVLDNERVKSAKQLMEHHYQSKERKHQQRINSLEDQVAELRAQLNNTNYPSTQRPPFNQAADSRVSSALGNTDHQRSVRDLDTLRSSTSSTDVVSPSRRRLESPVRQPISSITTTRTSSPTRLGSPTKITRDSPLRHSTRK